MTRPILAFALAFAASALGAAPALAQKVELDTTAGRIVLQLDAAAAPKTVENFVAYVKSGHYDGTQFHRVIPGFMIQGGDPTGTGTGNPGYVIPDEIRPNRLHEDAGTLSMANRGPGTGGAQFFVTLGPTPHLDGKHTVFGQCTERSAQLADDISLVPRDSNDKPSEDEVIETVRIVRHP